MEVKFLSSGSCPSGCFNALSFCFTGKRILLLLLLQLRQRFVWQLQIRYTYTYIHSLACSRHYALCCASLTFCIAYFLAPAIFASSPTFFIAYFSAQSQKYCQAAVERIMQLKLIRLLSHLSTVSAEPKPKFLKLLFCISHNIFAFSSTVPASASAFSYLLHCLVAATCASSAMNSPHFISCKYGVSHYLDIFQEELRHWGPWKSVD